MATFFTFLGIIALIIFLKFIYDTHLTDNYKEDWEKFKISHPEQAARIERNKGLDLNVSPKSSEKDKKNSLSRMSENMGVAPNDLKNNYFKGLRERQLSLGELQEAIIILRQEKYKESKIFDIDPDDTASAFLEEWTQEFIRDKDYELRQRTNFEIVQDLINENHELKILSKKNFKEAHKRLIEEYDDDELLELIAYAERPAERMRRKAIKLSSEKKYFEAIKLLDKALTINEPDTEPFLYSFRADCNESLLKYNEALTDTNKALQSILSNFPDDYYWISTFYNDRAKIRQKIGDIDGALQDKKTSEEYYAKVNFEDEGDGLPF